ncbi:MAG: DinB family protein [Anaerolineae bacterium]
MADPYNKAEILAQLESVQRSVHDNIAAMTETQFNAGTDESWSAAGYLKHLILSVKPVAKALGFPPERLQGLFGQPDHSSRTFADVMAAYKARLADGIRAEDFDRVTPVTYRFPEGITDEKAYLTDTWDESNQRLLTAVSTWDEAALDTHQMPHPAIGMITVREMLFFTLFHNSLHAEDIRKAGAAAV